MIRKYSEVRYQIRHEVFRRQYDFIDRVRGNYFKRYVAGSTIVVLDPEMAAIFPSSQAVNEGLRTFMRVAGYNKKLLRIRKTRRRA